MEKDKSYIIELPCMIGNTVWYLQKRYSVYTKTISEKIEEVCIYDKYIIFKTANIAFNKCNIGKTVFLTKEEAEKALRKEDEEK